MSYTDSNTATMASESPSPWPSDIQDSTLACPVSTSPWGPPHLNSRTRPSPPPAPRPAFRELDRPMPPPLGHYPGLESPPLRSQPSQALPFPLPLPRLRRRQSSGHSSETLGRSPSPVTLPPFHGLFGQYDHLFHIAPRPAQPANVQSPTRPAKHGSRRQSTPPRGTASSPREPRLHHAEIIMAEYGVQALTVHIKGDAGDYKSRCVCPRRRGRRQAGDKFQVITICRRCERVRWYDQRASRRVAKGGV